MVCEVCGKNEATVHVTEILDDKMTELHLCEGCAREKGAAAKQSFSIADLLAGLADISTVMGPEEAVKRKCPVCGLSYKDFRNIGRLGCGECYDTFKESLLPLLKRIHGSSQHLGKSPSRKKRIVKSGVDIQELKDKLSRAVQLERYEDAARFRDQIRALEKSSGKKGKGKKA